MEYEKEAQRKRQGAREEAHTPVRQRGEQLLLEGLQLPGLGCRAISLAAQCFQLRLQLLHHVPPHLALLSCRGQLLREVDAPLLVIVVVIAAGKGLA